GRLPSHAPTNDLWPAAKHSLSTRFRNIGALMELPFLTTWLGKKTSRSTNRHPGRAPVHKRLRFFRPLIEQLEDRILLALFTVNSLADTSVIDGSNTSGLLTLRDAILVENGTLALGSLPSGEQAKITGSPHAAGGDSIQFAPALAGQTIT